MNSKEYKNYLFDLYGTLVDIHTEEDDPALWQHMAGRLEAKGAVWEPEELRRFYRQEVLRLEQEAQAALGKGSWPEIDLEPVFRRMLARSGAEAEQSEVAALAWEFRQQSIRKLGLFDGARELLERLRKAGRRVYLLSNAQALFTMPELKRLGLEPLFDGILLSSAAGRKKPDPLFYRELLERFHLDPRVTVMVGNDDQADCHGAAGAGLDSMYVRTEQSPSPQGPLPENCRRIEKISEVF